MNFGSLPSNLIVNKKDLELVNYLKSDAMGAVFKAIWQRGSFKTDVAVKVIRTRGSEILADIFHEVQVMTNLHFSNICKIYGVCVVSEKELWLVLELADCSLHDFIASNNLLYSQQLSFALQAAQALEYIHSLPIPIVHRDITARSFLVQNNSTLLLSGFGLAKAFSLVSFQTETFKSLRWSAPEVLEEDKAWSTKSDIYSLGMVLYEMVAGEVPFGEEQWNFDKIVTKIRSGKRPKIPKTCPKDFAKIIKLCWHQSTKARPSAKELVTLLRDCQTKNFPKLSNLIGSKPSTCTWLCT